jgi:hypothetical protein
MTMEEFHRHHEAAAPGDALHAALRRLTDADDLERLRAVEHGAWAEWPNGADAGEARATPAAPSPAR